MVDKLQFPQLVQAFWTINSTVDAINPAPVDMVNIPCTYKVLAPSFRWLFLRISLPINRMGYSPYPLVRCFQQLQPSLQVTKEVSIAPFPSPPDRYLTWKVRNIHRYLGKKKNTFHKRLKSLGLFCYQHKYCALLNVGELPFCIP